MAELTWFIQSTGNVAFTLSDIDQDTLDPEFSEFVYGLIENANAPDFRRSQRENDIAEIYQADIDRITGEMQTQTKVIADQKKLLVSLKAEMGVYKEQLEIETELPTMNGTEPIMPYMTGDLHRVMGGVPEQD